MFSYIWPIGLVVVSNIFYQICAKSMSFGIDPFASLVVSYATAAAISLIMYFIFNRGGNIIAEFSKLNWAPFVLGIVIIGLEVGVIMAYQAGWQVSMASIVQSSFVAVALLFIGWIFYKEKLSWNKIVGIVICLTGLGFINFK